VARGCPDADQRVKTETALVRRRNVKRCLTMVETERDIEMNRHAERIAKGLAAARRACADLRPCLSDDQFEIIVDQMALACSDNSVGPFNYDAFVARAYRNGEGA
jgi:hypothetical protein